MNRPRIASKTKAAAVEAIANKKEL